MGPSCWELKGLVSWSWSTFSSKDRSSASYKRCYHNAEHNFQTTTVHNMNQTWWKNNHRETLFSRSEHVLVVLESCKMQCSLHWERNRRTKRNSWDGENKIVKLLSADDKDSFPPVNFFSHFSKKLTAITNRSCFVQFSFSHCGLFPFLRYSRYENRYNLRNKEYFVEGFFRSGEGCLENRT